MLIPIHDRVIVRPVVEPDDAKEERLGALRGVVLSAGPGAPCPQGGFLPMQVKVGDVVYFGKYSGVTLTIPGDEQLRVMREDEVLAVVDRSKS